MPSQNTTAGASTGPLTRYQIGVWSRPTAKPSRSVSSRLGDGLGLLRGTALVVFARELIHRRILHDVLAGQLPGLLNDPGERAVLARRLVLNLLQHLLGEVQGLLALIGPGHGASANAQSRGLCEEIIVLAQPRCQSGAVCPTVYRFGCGVM